MPKIFRAAELVADSSTREAPYAIITADCSDPREIDDGIFVEPLDAGSEAYRVGVCVADTSKLYDNGAIRKEALANGSAKYWDLPGGERGYDPMIAPEVIRELEFTRETVRDALILSFMVGKGIPPTGLQVDYGKVQVLCNLTYKQFAEKTVKHEAFSRFVAVSGLIRAGLAYNPGGDHTKSLAAAGSTAVSSVSHNKWLNGARMNESYMIAANYLIGKLLTNEGRPAIYRLHTPDDTSYSDFLASNMARYSLTPGPHTGLNLDMYCRVTSPLRRLEDFMMAYQLRKRHEGKPVTAADGKQLGAAVQRLNQEIAMQALNASGVLNKQSRAVIRQLEAVRLAGA